jgi:hypothetical protein
MAETKTLIHYPWAGETPRPDRIRCSLDDLLRAYYDVQARFARKMAAHREADHG